MGQEEDYMRQALALAHLAKAQGEVPVGAVLLGADGTLLAVGHNCPIGTHDPTAHAEIVTLREASLLQQNYRLTGSTLFVTLEPCLMCLGALVHARVGRLVYGASDPKGGAITGLLPWLRARLNHQIQCQGGILETECASLLQSFFQSKRT